MKNDLDFDNLLKIAPNFKLRRAMERLREGLFDPLGVKLLTTGDMDINHQLETQTTNLEKGKAAHLCVCGAYGEGKSHTLNYIRQQALEDNFAVSYINLDPREVPFHNLKQVYRSLMDNLTFPDEIATDIDINLPNNLNSTNSKTVLNTYSISSTRSRSNTNSTFVDTWKKSVRQWLSIPENRGKSVAEMIPKTIPHRFKSILTAMVQQTKTISNGKRNLKKHAGFKPREFPWVLNSAFLGKEIPVTQLRTALWYRQVSFYKEESLVCKDDHLYLEAIQGYGALFQNMGYKGWIVLFDEAESIMLTPIASRSKSYSTLHEIFCPDKPARGFFPVFAFTHDFFTYLKDENFERTRIIRRRKSATKILPPESEISENQDKIIKTTNKDELSARPDNDQLSQERVLPFFEQNYSKAWQNINIYALRNLTSKEWHLLIRKVIQLHSLAYRWEPDVDAMDKMIFARLLKQADAESRMKLKLVVNLLDIEQQKRVISKSFIM